MYRPGGGGYFGGRGQSGGDYISSYLVTQMNMSTSTIAYSSLLYILSRTGLSSLGEIASLSQAQLSQLASSIQSQIDIDNSIITADSLSSIALGHQLNDPGGIQDQYNAALSTYNSNLTAYTKASTNIASAQSLLFSEQKLYSTLTFSSISTQSSITSYEAQYSTALANLSTDTSILNAYNNLYTLQSTQYISNLANYNAAYSSIQSTMSAMAYYSSMLVSTTGQYNSTSTAYAYLLSDYINYSTGILATDNYILQSTQAYYSSLISTQTQYMSTIVGYAKLSTTMQPTLLLAQAKESYLEAVDDENYYITLLDNAVISTAILDDRLRADPQNGGIKTLLDMNKSIINTYSTALLSTNAQRIMLEKTQSSIQQVITQSQLNDIDFLIAQTEDTIANDIIGQRSTMSTIASISTLIIQTIQEEFNIQSTINSLSSQYNFAVNLNTTLDGIINQYVQIESTLSSQQTSTLANISTYQQLSTLYAISSASTWSSISYYSTLEKFTISSISGYNVELSSIIWQISSIDASTLVVSSINSRSYAQFLSSSDGYYVYKKNDSDYLVGAYQYAAQVYNMNAGKCSADLLIRKIQNLNQMDALYYATLSPTIASADVLSNNNQRWGLMQINNRIDNYVINVLNPMQQMFSDLLGMVRTEMTQKGNFVSQRQAIFDNYEFPCLTGAISPSTLIAGNYTDAFATLNSLITSINSNINQKNIKLGAINTLLTSAIKTDIASIVGTDYFPNSVTQITATPALVFPEPTGSNVVLTDYGIIQPIVFPPLSLPTTLVTIYSSNSSDILYTSNQIAFYRRDGIDTFPNSATGVGYYVYYPDYTLLGIVTSVWVNARLGYSNTACYMLTFDRPVSWPGSNVTFYYSATRLG